MKNTLQIVALRVLNVFDFRFMALVFLIFAGTIAKGQTVGTLTFGSVTTDVSTGISKCVVTWSGIASGTSAKIVNIEFALSADVATPCVDQSLTSVTVVPPFSQNVSFPAKNKVKIYKSVNAGFALNQSYAPLCTLAFRAAPTTNTVTNLVDITATIASVKKTNNLFESIGVTPLNNAPMPGDYVVGGTIEIPDPGGLCGNSISNFTVKVESSPAPSCWPGGNANPYSELFDNTVYQFEGLPTGLPYTVSVSKTGGCDCGTPGSPSPWINDVDIAILHEIILGINQNPSLYNLLSGDAIANNTLTAYDLLQISKCELGLIASLPWNFYWYDDYISNDPPACSLCYPDPIYLKQSYTIPALSSNQNSLSFMAVKVGDVNQSCDDCGQNFGIPPEERALSTPVEAWLNKEAVRQGLDFLLPINVRGIAGVRTFDLGLYFDSEYLEVIGVEKGDLSDDYANFTITEKENATAFHYVWFTDKMGEDVPEGGALMNVRLRAKKDIAVLSDFVWQNGKESVNNIFYANAKEPFQQSKLILNTLWNEDKAQFSARLSGANPVQSSIGIEVFSPTQVEASFLFFDTDGSLMGQRQEDLSYGWNSFTEDIERFAPGVYSIVIRSVLEQHTLRFIKL